MAVHFLRTFLRSTQFLNGSLLNVSKPLGTANLLVRAPVVLPSHSEFTRSRNLMTTPIELASATRSKKATTAGHSTVKITKKEAATQAAAKQKATSSKKKLAAKKKLEAKRKLAAKKKLAKAKAKAAKPPKISKKHWTPPFKRPLNSWGRFVMQRPRSEPMNLGDHLRAASLEWKEMSEEQKAAYAPPISEFEEYHRNLAEWNANLPKSVQRAKRERHRSRLHRTAAPLTTMAQFVKEQFHQINFPPEATSSVLKLRHIARIFANELSEADKAGLKQRSWEEFTKANAAST